jgi:hypothetical protein
MDQAAAEPLVKDQTIVNAFYAFIATVCLTLLLAHFLAPDKKKRAKSDSVAQSTAAAESTPANVLPPPTTPAPQATADPFLPEKVVDAESVRNLLVRNYGDMDEKEPRARRTRFAEDDGDQATQKKSSSV